MSVTVGQATGMTVKVGIFLPDTTRLELADHMAMLVQTDDLDRLRHRARARTEARRGSSHA